MNEITQAEFARRNGWSRSHVTGLKHAGRLVMTDDGKRVLVKESLARIEATRDPNRDDVARRHEAERKQEAPAPSPMDDRVSATYQQSRAVKERYLALQAKAEYEERIGKLVGVEQVKKSAADIGALLKSTLENMQDQLSAEMAPEDDPECIYALLGERFEMLLTDIADAVGKIGVKES